MICKPGVPLFLPLLPFLSSANSWLSMICSMMSSICIIALLLAPPPLEPVSYWMARLFPFLEKKGIQSMYSRLFPFLEKKGIQSMYSFFLVVEMLNCPMPSIWKMGMELQAVTTLVNAAMALLQVNRSPPSAWIKAMSSRKLSSPSLVPNGMLRCALSPPSACVGTGLPLPRPAAGALGAIWGGCLEGGNLSCFPACLGAD